MTDELAPAKHHGNDTCSENTPKTVGAAAAETGIGLAPSPLAPHPRTARSVLVSPTAEAKASRIRPVVVFGRISPVPPSEPLLFVSLLRALPKACLMLRGLYEVFKGADLDGASHETA